MQNKQQRIEHLKSMAVYYRGQADENDAAAVWMEEHGDKLEGIECDHYGSFLNVKTPTREVLMRVLKAFPGKWKKSVNTEGKGTLDYSLFSEGNLVINCVSAPPPPSCQIVEEMVDIPAQPARRELRKVVKCTPDVENHKDEVLEMAEAF